MQIKIKILIGITIIILGTVSWFFYSINRDSLTVIPRYDVIFFYGRECPHCQDVEDFLQRNKVSEKINFDSIEVWHNRTNEATLLEKAKECGVDSNKIAVPFLYTNGRCFVGKQLVEDFFAKVGEK